MPMLSIMVAMLSYNDLLLNMYMYLWLYCGLELIYCGLFTRPLLRNVSVAIDKEVVPWLVSKMVFYMPTVIAVAPTAGYFPASKTGLTTLNP
jgi:hypothetical protein